MRPLSVRTLPGALLALFLVQGPLEAQDVELLGRLHGTRPPQSYFDLRARDPGAFEFRRALFRRGLGLRDLPPIQAEGRALSPAFTPALAMAAAADPQRAAVTGTFHFPLILGLFSDSPAPPALFSQGNVQAQFFDGPQPNPNAGTIPEFYSEISGGRVTLTGTTFDWARTGLTQAQVTAGVSALGINARIGEFIVQIIQALDDGALDWGQFDNDGPDGIPNSGDDDGYVDVLAVMHPTPGGECSSPDRANRIWSHRWNLASAAFYERSLWGDPSLALQIQNNPGYVTRTPATPSPFHSFGFIRILDYTAQSVTTCNGSTLNDIGVFAHELGHGFGLPDLYGVNASHNGIGNWGLMGTGSWGCDGSSPDRPCHMSAWSKSVLGWADVETLASGTDLGTLTLPPVESSGKIFRLDANDGSGEYLLIENRQRIGFDADLYEQGLLIWHVDPAVVAARWATNRINSDGSHLGVWLRQADGLDELAKENGGRGDRFDPFPGGSGNTVFHAGSNPSSWSHDGHPMGVTILDIAPVGQNMTFRALTRYQALTLKTEGSPSGKGLVTVDGATPQEAQWSLQSAPYQIHEISAAPGEEIGDGVRAGFLGWSDGAPRVREFATQLQDASLTALYGGTEVRFAVGMSSPVEGVAPGSLSFSPGDAEGWVPQGQMVVVTAQPRTGFGFREWTGALTGLSNPATLLASAPLEAAALFDLTFSTEGNPSSLDVQGGVSNFVTLQVQNANAPVVWTLVSGSLPQGMTLDQAGFINGVPMEGGSYALLLRVRDAIGLEGTVSVTLSVVDPQLSAATATSPFLLSGPTLPQPVQSYLDRAGNANGAYDLGDFRAYFLRNPNLPTSDQMESILELVVPLSPRGGDPGSDSSGDSRKEDLP